MPYYEYRCAECGAELTVKQSMGERALTHCPSCGSESLKRKISHGYVSTSKDAPCGAGSYSSCCACCPHGK